MDELTDILNSLEITETPTNNSFYIPDVEIDNILRDNNFFNNAQILSDNNSEITSVVSEEIEPLNVTELIDTSVISEIEEIQQEVINDTVTNTDIVEETVESSLLLPFNSPTLVLDEATSRFSSAEWFQEIKNKQITLAGVGGIGSNLAFQLSRLGIAKMILYDSDIVESGNISGQLYGWDNIGKPKVFAIRDIIDNFSSAPIIYCHSQFFENNSEASAIMFCGFDNMIARKTYFESWYNLVKSNIYNKEDCLFMDGRLSIDTLQIFCIRGDDTANIQKYRNNYLFSDEEAEETICSLKQTTYMSCMIAALMTNLFTNWVAESLDPILPYDVPFYTEYNAQNMIFKTEN